MHPTLGKRTEHDDDDIYYTDIVYENNAMKYFMSNAQSYSAICMQRKQPGENYALLLNYRAFDTTNSLMEEGLRSHFSFLWASRILSCDYVMHCLKKPSAQDLHPILGLNMRLSEHELCVVCFFMFLK